VFAVKLAPKVRRFLLTGSLILTAWLIGLGLTFINAWDQVELKLFDQLTVLTSPGKSVLPITIVGIDEASFAQLNLRWPWPRGLHGQLVDRLNEAGAAVIAFDLIFAEASDPKQDAAFAAAIGRAGNVIMSADRAYQETANLRQWLRVEPLPAFKQAGATPGLATVTLDSDTVVRQIPQNEDVFWRRTIETLIRARPGILDMPQPPADALIRHLGPAHTFPYVSYHQVLNRDPSIPADFFRDQIVLIGRDVRASPDAGAAQADMFATPFLGVSRLLTPGVEIHATIIENMLSSQALVRASNGQVMLLMAVALMLALPALIRWHPVWSGAWMTALLGLIAGLTVWLFAERNLWLPMGSTLVAITLAYLANGLASFILERRRGQQIKGAFAKYVSAQVVEQMVAHPELLKLGGERRELTLLFSDLAGFTSISEKLPPDGVAHLINAYLTAMTRVILAEGGTVDKFIGDAVMAFWGAPLDDPQHALHGVRAAIAMQKAMDDLQPFFAEFDVGYVGLRIGLNSGPATVGNMGSEERFDYTALGDTVNLAARLEGVNKAYGTRILISGATAELLEGAISLRPVDLVRVKGKDKAVEILTPCDDAEISRLTAAALAAYRAQDWDGARAAWRRVLENYPDDSVSKVFMERIENFEKTGVSAGWDGSVALEKG
jgi:adenylate cyclase